VHQADGMAVDGLHHRLSEVILHRLVVGVDAVLQTARVYAARLSLPPTSSTKGSRRSKTRITCVASIDRCRAMSECLAR
jgi:hypothetical protein